MDNEQNPTTNSGATPRLILRVAPFLLPVIFFQSAVFAFISPLPLFILTLRKSLWMGLLALLMNVGILITFGAHSEAFMAVFFWLSAGVLFPFLIRKSGKVQLSFLLSYLYLVLVIFAVICYFAHHVKMGPVDYIRDQMSIGMDHLIALPDSPMKKIADEQGRDVLLKQLLTELPSGVLIAILLSFWLNLLFASQILRGFLSKTFWSQYRTPAWLVWPTLACGALFAFGEHALYFIGLNGFKILLTVYGLQGLSILSYLLNRYKIYGFGRAILFSIALFIGMPLVLSLGFFDLWFDFRHKFGQS